MEMNEILVPKIRKWPLERVDIQCTETVCIPQSENPELAAVVNRVLCCVIELLDNGMYELAIRASKDAGIETAYFIDKQFLLDALREKLERDFCE